MLRSLGSQNAAQPDKAPQIRSRRHQARPVRRRGFGIHDHLQLRIQELTIGQELVPKQIQAFSAAHQQHPELPIFPAVIERVFLQQTVQGVCQSFFQIPLLLLLFRIAHLIRPPLYISGLIIAHREIKDNLLQFPLEKKNCLCYNNPTH